MQTELIRLLAQCPSGKGYAGTQTPYCQPCSSTCTEAMSNYYATHYTLTETCYDTYNILYNDGSDLYCDLCENYPDYIASSDEAQCVESCPYPFFSLYAPKAELKYRVCGFDLNLSREPLIAFIIIGVGGYLCCLATLNMAFYQRINRPAYLLRKLQSQFVARQSSTRGTMSSAARVRGGSSREYVALSSKEDDVLESMEGTAPTAAADTTAQIDVSPAQPHAHIPREVDDNDFPAYTLFAPSRDQHNEGAMDLQVDFALLFFFITLTVLPFLDTFSDLLYVLGSPFYRFWVFMVTWVFFLLHPMGALLLELTSERVLVPHMYVPTWYRRSARRLWSMWCGGSYGADGDGDAEGAGRMSMCLRVVWDVWVVVSGGGPCLVVNVCGHGVWFVFGVLLFSSKMMCIGPIYNLWYGVWTGFDAHFRTPKLVETSWFKREIYAGMLLESVPQLVIQTYNAVQLRDLTTFNTFSIATSSFMIYTGLYQLWYMKYIRRSKVVEEKTGLEHWNRLVDLARVQSVYGVGGVGKSKVSQPHAQPGGEEPGLARKDSQGSSDSWHTSFVSSRFVAGSSSAVPRNVTAGEQRDIVSVLQRFSSYWHQQQLSASSSASASASAFAPVSSPHAVYVQAAELRMSDLQAGGQSTVLQTYEAQLRRWQERRAELEAQLSST